MGKASQNKEQRVVSLNREASRVRSVIFMNRLGELVESSDGMTYVEIIGCLELTKMNVYQRALLNNHDEEDEE
jgi:hypothetical protein